MKICALNCNGARSALKKGFGEWLLAERPEAALLQEIKAGVEDFPFKEFERFGYGCVAFPAEKKGYSGTAILVRSELTVDEQFKGFGSKEFDAEGRCCFVRIGSLWLGSIYAPSGSSGEERQAAKERFMPAFEQWFDAFMKGAADRGESAVVGGDFNVTRSDFDLKNWRGNRKSSGCLPHERAWIERLVACGAEDLHRKLNPSEPGYSWWSQRAKAWDSDSGWRIDYLFASGEAAKAAQAVKTHRDLRFSDHAPVVGEFVWTESSQFKVDGEATRQG